MQSGASEVIEWVKQQISEDEFDEMGTILSEGQVTFDKETQSNWKIEGDLKNVLKKHNLELASSWHSTFFLSQDIDSQLEKVRQKCSLLNN